MIENQLTAILNELKEIRKVLGGGVFDNARIEVAYKCDKCGYNITYMKGLSESIDNKIDCDGEKACDGTMILQKTTTSFQNKKDPGK